MHSVSSGKRRNPKLFPVSQMAGIFCLFVDRNYLHDPVWNICHPTVSNSPVTHQTVKPLFDWCEYLQVDHVTFSQLHRQHPVTWRRDYTKSRKWETDRMQRTRYTLSEKRCQSAGAANKTPETYLQIPFHKRTNLPCCNPRTWTHFFWNGTLTP